jgi:hypothetical protein
MTLGDARIREACCERLGRIDPLTAPKWGRMNAHQMVCHLNDSFRVAMGEKVASPATNWMQRTVVKWAALNGPMKWPHGVATRPEVEQGRGGTVPVDWERDRAQLRGLILGFADLTKFAPHPVFDKMSRTEWMIWGYRHVDHHFRQFGV